MCLWTMHAFAGFLSTFNHNHKTAQLWRIESIKIVYLTQKLLMHR